MKIPLLSVLAIVSAAAAAQTPPVDQKPAAQPAPRPALKLRLDEIDPEPARPAPPREPAKGNDAGGGLPGLGGPPREVWTQRKTDPIPKNTSGDQPSVNIPQ